MEQVSNAVKAKMEGTSSSDSFLRVAQVWAAWCLENNVGHLLDAGLEISKALTEYEAILRRPDLDIS